jgi:hypothetical protein
MHPMLLLLLALVTPFALGATLLLPAYAGIASASYLIYSASGNAAPLLAKLTDVFYIVEVYHQLFAHWVANKSAVSLLTYTAPLLLLPLAGFIIALWLGRKLVRYLSDIFHMSVSAN